MMHKLTTRLMSDNDVRMKSYSVFWSSQSKIKAVETLINPLQPLPTVLLPLDLFKQHHTTLIRHQPPHNLTSLPLLNRNRLTSTLTMQLVFEPYMLSRRLKLENSTSREEMSSKCWIEGSRNGGEAHVMGKLV